MWVIWRAPSREASAPAAPGPRIELAPGLTRGPGRREEGVEARVFRLGYWAVTQAVSTDGSSGSTGSHESPRSRVT